MPGGFSQIRSLAFSAPQRALWQGFRKMMPSAIGSGAPEATMFDRRTAVKMKKEPAFKVGDVGLRDSSELGLRQCAQARISAHAIVCPGSRSDVSLAGSNVL